MLKRIGNRKDVIAGRAYKTRSGLTINDFEKKSDGRWVSKAKSAAAKKRWNNDANLRQTFENSRAPPFSKNKK
jgi:hypothetical protein